MTDHASTAPRRIAVVANRGSGSHDADAVRREVAQVFDAAGVDWSWHAQGGAGAAALDAAVREALTREPDVLVAAGGDGTINTVVNAIVQRPQQEQPVLGLLPLGTFNLVARRHAIPVGDAGAAAAIVVGGRTQRIGAGDVNGHLFLNNCCFGLYTSLIDARERHKARFGRHRIVAFISALATLLQPHGRQTVRLSLPGRTLRLRTSLVYIGANPEQLDEFDDEFAAAVERGALGFVALRSVGLGVLLRFAWGALEGHAAELQEIETEVIEQAEIELRRRRLRCVVDGEVQPMTTPLRLRWVADRLSLRVPAAAAPAA